MARAALFEDRLAVRLVIVARLVAKRQLSLVTTPADLDPTDSGHRLEHDNLVVIRVEISVLH